MVTHTPTVRQHMSSHPTMSSSRYSLLWLLNVISLFIDNSIRNIGSMSKQKRQLITGILNGVLIVELML